MDYSKRNTHHVVASDTDSAYFCLTPLLAKMYPEYETMDRTEKINILLKISEKIQNYSFNKFKIF